MGTTLAIIYLTFVNSFSLKRKRTELLLKVAKVVASSADAGRLFQTGFCCGEKLSLKQLVPAEICWNFKHRFDLVLVGPGERRCSQGMSVRLLMILYNIFSWPLVFPNSSNSQFSSSSIDVALLVLLYLLVPCCADLQPSPVTLFILSIFFLLAHSSDFFSSDFFDKR